MRCWCVMAVPWIFTLDIQISQDIESCCRPGVQIRLSVKLHIMYQHPRLLILSELFSNITLQLNTSTQMCWVGQVAPRILLKLTSNQNIYNVQCQLYSSDGEKRGQDFEVSTKILESLSQYFEQFHEPGRFGFSEVPGSLSMIKFVDKCDSANKCFQHTREICKHL